MIEIPVDLAMEDIGRATIDYKPVPITRPAGNPEEIEKAVNRASERRLSHLFRRAGGSLR